MSNILDSYLIVTVKMNVNYSLKVTENQVCPFSDSYQIPRHLGQFF